MSEPLRQMAKGGRTFYFASMWLDRTTRYNAAVAYSFCRMVDDIADTMLPGERRSTALANILAAIENHDTSCREASPMLDLIERFPQIHEPVAGLVRACTIDTPGIRIKDTSELIRYAHGVAGTVGLIMYPLLGGTNPDGRQHAADLGIAMQCTNIARDVISDLKENRIYLPQDWLYGIDPYLLFRHDSAAEEVIVSAVQRLLSISSDYYSRGLRGLSYLEPRCRFAIRVAADCYAAIGERVIHRGRITRERAVVPLHAKVALMLRASRTSKRLQGATAAEAAR
jgi:phytoene synthase